MPAELTTNNMFDPEVVTDLFNKVRGESTLAKLSKRTPVAFTGNKIFTFSMDGEVNIVAENGEKTNGGVTVAAIKMTPIKIEYGARVTDEFMYASEEKKLDILRAFNEGFSRKVARGIDIMGFHGYNPRTGAASAIIGTNSIKTATGVTTITYDATDLEGNLEDAVAAIGDYDPTGFAFSKVFASSLAKLTVNGVKQYPEFALGGNPGQLNGNACDVNSTVSADGGQAPTRAIIGDFENAFKWGFAKEIPLEVIPYGDPDQSGKDLKAYNQVFLRAEAYVGWAILDPTAFARIA